MSEKPYTSASKTPTNSSDFGKLLRQRRLEAGKSQADTARLLGISTPYISDIERGRRNPLDQHKIRKVAEFLGGDAEDLLDAAAMSRGRFLLEIGVSDVHDKTGARLARTWNSLTETQCRELLIVLRPEKSEIGSAAQHAARPSR